jgi:nucleoid-associated protein YgaU
MSIRQYTVRNGDTLTSISEKVYGSPDYSDFIYRHNTHNIADPNQLHPLQVIAVPHLSVGEAALHLIRAAFND